LLGGTHPGWDLPEEDKKVGAVFAGDGSSRYGKVSAYLQGANAAVEAICNVVAVGGIPRALTDCLNYGNPEIPEHLSALEEGVRGIADAARGLAIDGEAVPIISGNVSLYNSLPNGSAIPPSAVVCCIGMLPDASKAVSMHFKKPDSVLLLLGEPKDECGGSALYEVLERAGSFPVDSLLGANVPNPDFESIRMRIEALHAMMREGLILSCHDISEGGILLALFEMTLPVRGIGGHIGAAIDVAVPSITLSPVQTLFTQSQGFLLEVGKEHLASVRTIAAQSQTQLHALGTTKHEPTLDVCAGSASILNEPLEELGELWRNGLTHAWGK
jgi:phosphoribosylformylglycinamidine synthase